MYNVIGCIKIKPFINCIFMFKLVNILFLKFKKNKFIKKRDKINNIFNILFKK